MLSYESWKVVNEIMTASANDKNLPLPLPSTTLRACFFKEGDQSGRSKWLLQKILAHSPFAKGEYKGIWIVLKTLSRE